MTETINEIVAITNSMFEPYTLKARSCFELRSSLSNKAGS